MKTVHIPMLAVAGAAVWLTPSWVFAQAASDPGWSGRGPHMMWWNGAWPGMVFGPLFMVLVLALAIAGAVLLVRWLAGPRPGTQPHQAPARRTAVDILKERFARGEVDKEEFEERRRLSVIDPSTGLHFFKSRMGAVEHAEMRSLFDSLSSRDVAPVESRRHFDPHQCPPAALA